VAAARLERGAPSLKLVQRRKSLGRQWKRGFGWVICRALDGFARMKEWSRPAAAGN
jgi:hypothetical protein